MNKKTYISPKTIAISNFVMEPMMAASGTPAPPADTELDDDEEINDIEQIESKPHNCYSVWDD